MILGVGLVLVAIGALLAFAVHLYTNAGDIQMIGVLLMAVGAAALALDVKVITPRRRAADRDAKAARAPRRRAAA